MKKLKIFSLIIFATGTVFFQSCMKLKTIVPACPTIISLSPNSAHSGEKIEIIGENFEPGHPELYKISIAGNLIHDNDIIDVPNSNTLRFKVTEGIGSGKLSVLRVRSDTCSSNSMEFTYKITIIGKKDLIDTDLSGPTGMDVDTIGNIILADKFHNQIKKFTTDGTIIWTAGNGYADTLDNNKDSAVSFFYPEDVAINLSRSFIYVADANHSCIRRINKDGYVDTYGGQINKSGNDDGSIAESKFTKPTGVAVDENGSFYTIEYSKHRLRFVDISTGKVITLIGKSSPSLLNFPTRVIYSKKRNSQYPVLIADSGKIEQVNPTDYNNITTIPIPLDFSPYDLAMDQFGDIIVLDKNNLPLGNRILIIYTDGSKVDLSTEGLNYYFESLSGIAIDIKKNRIYISDAKLNKVVVFSYK